MWGMYPDGVFFPKCILPPTTNDKPTNQAGCSIMDTYDLCRGAVAPEAAQRLLVTWRFQHVGNFLWSPHRLRKIFSEDFHLFETSSKSPWKSMVFEVPFSCGDGHPVQNGQRLVKPGSVSLRKPGWQIHRFFSTDSNPSLSFPAIGDDFFDFKKKKQMGWSHQLYILYVISG